MPELSTDERIVLEHLRAWYRTRRGALSAARVAAETGLPAEAVRAAAGVLTVAAGVRTSSCAAHRGPAGEVVFLDAPQPPRRVIDLTRGPLEEAAARRR